MIDYEDAYDTAKEIEAQASRPDQWNNLYDFFRWAMDCTEEQAMRHADAALKAIIEDEI